MTTESNGESVSRWRVWLRGTHRPSGAVLGWLGFYLFLVWVSYVAGKLSLELRLEFPSRWEILARSLSGVTGMWACMLGCLLLTQRFRIRRTNLRRSLSVHLLAGLLMQNAAIAYTLGMNKAGLERIPCGTCPPRSTNRPSPFNVIPYFVLIGIFHAYYLALETRRNSRKALELTAELSEAARLRAEAELRALKSELNPRFMADSVATIAALVHTAPHRAEEEITRLGDVVNGALGRVPAGEPDEVDDIPEPPSPAAPLETSIRTRELRRIPLTVVGFAALYWWDHTTDPKEAFERRVYGPELPSFYFEMRHVVTALVLTLIILTAVELNRRYPWTDQETPKRQRLRVHGAAVFGLGLLLNAKNWAFYVGYGLLLDMSALNLAHAALRSMVGALLMFYAPATVINIMLVGGWRRLRSYRDELRLRAQVSETMRRRAEAELRALEAELNPHFLGNALHAAAGLIRSAPDQAVHVLGQLEQLLREPASHAGAHEVTLAEELAMLHPFLEVERARIQRPLPMRWSVDQATLAASVPRMILQPLVENAVRHGLARSGPGALTGIELSARRVNGSLEIIVADDGAGVPADAAMAPRRSGARVGVANTKARLKELYGANASFELAARPGGGTIARLLIPWRDEPAVTPAVGVTHLTELLPA